MTKKQVVIGFIAMMLIPTICVVDEPSATTIGVWFIFFFMLAIVASLAVATPETEE